MNDLVKFVDTVIEEYKDGRVSSCLMLNYLYRIKTKAMETQG